MDRGASAGVLAEMAADMSRPFHLFVAVFDDETVRACDLDRNVTWGGDLYYGDGRFLGFEGIQETADLQVTEARVSLSGVDQVWISTVLSKEYTDRQLLVYKAFLDADDALISNPVLVFDGRMDAPIIDDDPLGGTSVVTVTATSHWVDFERRPGRHTNDMEQQVHFPGDRFFEYVTEVNRAVVWGRK